MNALRAPRLRPIPITILAVVLLWTLLPAAAAARESGTLVGTVLNETTGSPAPGVEVTLTGFTSDGITGEWTITTDDEGRFEFQDIDTSDGIVYAASISHRGVLYSSGMIRFLDSDEQMTTIRVYETTTDRSVVEVNSRGIVLSEIDPPSGTATILDIVALTVDGDRTYIAGDTGRSVEFPVPRNAGTPTLLPGFDFGTAVVENSVVFASSALRPDGGSATLSYPVQYTGSGFAIDLRNAYPTASFRILIPTDLTADADSITIAAAGFENEGAVRIGEREYHVWGAVDLPRDSNVRIAFGSLPQSGFEPNRLRVKEPAILAGLLLMGATAATAVFIRRGRFQTVEPALEEAVTAGFIESREELVLQLQELQDEFDHGLIDEELFLSERRFLLERLRAVSRHLRDTPLSDAPE